MISRPLLLLSLCAGALPWGLHASKSILQISLGDLREGTRGQELELALQQDGAIAVTGLGLDYEMAVKGLKAAAPTCFMELSIPMFELTDGSMRTTLATMEEDSIHYPFCVESHANTIRGQFDVVFGLVAKIFGNIVGVENLQWSAQPSDSTQNFENLLKKEHLHVYHAPQETKDTFAQPFHTDNGVLLMITPFKEHPIRIKSRNHENIESSELPDDAVILIVARALPGWLLEGTGLADRFFAAPHAVPSLPVNSQPRTVFARMMVAPMTAVSARKGTTKTFQDIFLNQDAEQLCLPVQARTPSGWEQLQEQDCPDNMAYCWMTCLALPSCLPTEDFVCTNIDGDSCCTDTILENCADMDGSCAWKCE